VVADSQGSTSDEHSPMPSDSANHGQPGHPIRTNDYDSFADAYSAENETSLQNVYYERAAMLALAGDVAGRCTR
jgi:hypothetical protein